MEITREGLRGLRWSLMGHSGSAGDETITGTPEHPFWVPAVGDYIAMGDLEVGAVLGTESGGEARVASMEWREGDFEVFNFEVEGVHNYYVRAPRGEVDAVLVHNGCGDIKGGPFKVLEQDGDAVHMMADLGNGNQLEVMANVTKQGDSLVADQVHVYSSGGPNTIGRTQMKELAQEFGKANDATEVTIKGGARATGPKKGQRPKEVTFDVPED